jgi:regulator of nucleoside diphosphate kinase
MSDTEHYLLTVKDYTILEAMLDRWPGHADATARLLRSKLAKAIIMLPRDIPATAVTLNSRVKFRVDENPVETRILAHGEMRDLVGLTIPLSSPRGLAMLGTRQGQSVAVERRDGGTERISVLQILHQPEAAAREEAGSQAPRSAGPLLTVVHRSDDINERPTQPATETVFTDLDDDPGPSAA